MQTSNKNYLKTRWIHAVKCSPVRVNTSYLKAKLSLSTFCNSELEYTGTDIVAYKAVKSPHASGDCAQITVVNHCNKMVWSGVYDFINVKWLSWELVRYNKQTHKVNARLTHDGHGMSLLPRSRNVVGYNGVSPFGGNILRAVLLQPERRKGSANAFLFASIGGWAVTTAGMGGEPRQMIPVKKLSTMPTPHIQATRGGKREAPKRPEQAMTPWEEAHFLCLADVAVTENNMRTNVNAYNDSCFRSALSYYLERAPVRNGKPMVGAYVNLKNATARASEETVAKELARLNSYDIQNVTVNSLLKSRLTKVKPWDEQGFIEALDAGLNPNARDFGFRGV